MYLKINDTDVSCYIKEKGIKWSRNDIESDNAGRWEMMDGEMIRDRVAIKYRLDVSCMPLKQEDAQILLALIEPQFVTVETISPRHGPVEWVMYSNNVPATHCTTGSNGQEYWTGITFPLVQK